MGTLRKQSWLTIKTHNKYYSELSINAYFTFSSAWSQLDLNSRSTSPCYHVVVVCKKILLNWWACQEADSIVGSLVPRTFDASHLDLIDWDWCLNCSRLGFLAFLLVLPLPHCYYLAGPVRTTCAGWATWVVALDFQIICVRDILQQLLWVHGFGGTCITP